MSAEDLAAALCDQLRPQLPDPRARHGVAATVADCESRVAAALALFLQGESAAVLAVLGTPETAAGRAQIVPLIALMTAAAGAVTAAVGDDPSRGYAALATLQERSAEYAEAFQLLTQHTEETGNPE